MSVWGGEEFWSMTAQASTCLAGHSRALSIHLFFLPQIHSISFRIGARIIANNTQLHLGHQPSIIFSLTTSLLRIKHVHTCRKSKDNMENYFFPSQTRKSTVSHKVEQILYNSTQTFPPTNFNSTCPTCSGIVLSHWKHCSFIKIEWF